MRAASRLALPCPYTYGCPCCQVTALGSAMSATELAAALAQTRSQVAALQSRLARFEGPDAAPLVTPQERAAAVAALDKYRRAWASRRACVMEVVGASEQTGGRERERRRRRSARSPPTPSSPASVRGHGQAAAAALR